MGDGDDLTSQAIAELIREIESGEPRSSTRVQERKVNPLVNKPNKRFLGRTITTALRHNQRESERTQAECQRKLKDLDERYEKRKSNYYYNRDAGRYRSRSPSRSRRKQARKVKKRRSRSSSSRSRSRHRSHKKRKHQSKHKRRKKTKHRRRSPSSSSSSSSEEKPVPTVTGMSSSELFFHHSRQMALAVAMAYSSQGANGAPENGRKTKERASSSSDIARELMSDDEHGNGNADSTLIDFLSSSDKGQELLTIDVSSSSSESRGAESDPENGAGCFIALDDSTTELESGHNSDIEIIEECQAEQDEEPEPERGTIDSVDLTED
ncbi:splicing regulatory glutamine/lysine-rich protein 1 isoform X2 [Drosophila obscura]|uniref:splicing regulatory glutamine/lysine-rich protein 1 isoform X2 n=1 Tax=Drosophila obscura TaxID=7282 RepID=UPI001BB2B0CE|nr:splicing regulatory glutamine/lysine-rich protein 1 isoform X2 [Drosophila obscura]